MMKPSCVMHKPIVSRQESNSTFLQSPKRLSEQGDRNTRDHSRPPASGLHERSGIGSVGVASARRAIVVVVFQRQGAVEQQRLRAVDIADRDDALVELVVGAGADKLTQRLVQAGVFVTTAVLGLVATAADGSRLVLLARLIVVVIRARVRVVIYRVRPQMVAGPEGVGG